ncbi:MAG: D-alanyl-D-alanine carboxypeptidase/D-alanyl-D-alanine-endopeptidase [Deltaproteobacteria bacterium]|nr:MAG: D-alanyl-D-alanine carboxypeptidase/D-alanyl-D-alanine-endopeptidase [Deltaproteobacteria bacterium]
MKLLKVCHSLIIFLLIFSTLSISLQASSKKNHAAVRKSSLSKPPKTSHKNTPYRRGSLALNPEGTLSEQMDYILRETGLNACLVGLKAVELGSGKILFEKNPDQPMNPASNTKIVTEAASLDLLGPHYTFKTDFLSEASIDPDGKLHNIWIRGYGDPVFTTEEMEAVVDAFVDAGLKEISGNVYIDDSYFGNDHNIHYSSRSGGKDYTIVLGALSYNFNRGQIKLSQSSEEEAEQTTINFRKKSSRKNRSRRKAIIKKRTINAAQNPALAFGTAFIQAMESNGIDIKGKVIEGIAPQGSTKVLTHHSPELSEVLKGMGKFSNNFIAEQVLRVIGGEKYGEPASLDKGLEAAREYLTSLGIDSHEFALDNGSGLSLYNRLSPSQFIEILKAVYRSPYRDEFIDSLSIAGTDGTLKRRLKVPELMGKVFAKTGTLNEVSSLSGYLFLNRKRIAFSLLLNDVTIPHDRLVIAKQEILRSIAREFE